MFHAIKETYTNLFRTPTALEMASKELAQAERSLLEAQSAREYADAMVTYHGDRIDRLRRYIREANES